MQLYYGSLQLCSVVCRIQLRILFKCKEMSLRVLSVAYHPKICPYYFCILRYYVLFVKCVLLNTSFSEKIFESTIL